MNNNEHGSSAIIRRNRLMAYAFLAPNLLGFVAFTLIPVIAAMVLSFTRWDGSSPMRFVGLSNYLKLFSSSDFIISFRNTVIYTFGTVPLIMILAIALSILINSGIKGADFFRAFHFFPHISSIVAIAVVWQFLYHPSMGPINRTLSALGISNLPSWLASANWALPAVMLMIVWKSVGYYMIIYLAGLQGISTSLYEAATIDGAGKWKSIWYITLPMLRGTNFYVAVIAVINSFQVFTPIFVMTQGGPGRATRVLVYQIYIEAFQNFEFGYASAMSMVLFVCIFVVTVIQFHYQNKVDY